jgi:hypothetical protein
VLPGWEWDLCLISCFDMRRHASTSQPTALLQDATDAKALALVQAGKEDEAATVLETFSRKTSYTVRAPS